jgi:hypothetical protein
MRKSREVPLTLLATVALAAGSGCSHPREVRNCVDAQGRIVPDSVCETHHGGMVPFFFLYGGRSGGRFGDTVIGGRATPTAGANIYSGESGRVIGRGSSSAAVRGGFGAHGGEGGE